MPSACLEGYKEYCYKKSKRLVIKAWMITTDTKPGSTYFFKRIPRRNHITPVLRELHWLRIHDRIIFKNLPLTHKAVNNTAPEYLCDLIRLNVKSTTIVHVHPLILVYYVFPQSVNRVLIHSLIDLLCMLLQHCGMPLIYILDYCPWILS